MTVRSVVTDAYVGKKSVVRQVVPVRVVMGVTQYYNINLMRNGSLIASTRVSLGDASLYPNASAWASSGSMDAAGSFFGYVPLSPLLAARVWFPGWYTVVSGQVVDAYVQFAATGEGAEICSITVETSNGTVHTDVPRVSTHLTGYNYELTANSSSGDWIGDLSLIDRQATLDAYNAQKGVAAAIAPPSPPEVGIELPAAVLPAVDQSGLYGQVATLGTKVDVLIAMLAALQRSSATVDHLRSVNSNVVMAGSNGIRIADSTTALLQKIDDKTMSKSQRIIENSAVNLVAALLTK